MISTDLCRILGIQGMCCEHHRQYFFLFGNLKQFITVDAHDVQNGNIEALAIHQLLAGFKLGGCRHFSHGQTFL
jgi:hypothetical protein